MSSTSELGKRQQRVEDMVDFTQDAEDSKRLKTIDSLDEFSAGEYSSSDDEIDLTGDAYVDVGDGANRPNENDVVDEENFEFHPKQQEAIDLAKEGANVFLTGPGGTGKSVVLRRIIKDISQKYKSEEWAAVASTGIAAVPIEGQTIHRFSGCGVPVLKSDFGKCWNKREEWRSLKVLVVEEVSMISGEFLDNLSDVVRNIRDDSRFGSSNEDKNKPFGGIQLILCGDFLQLPPIPKRMRDIMAMSNSGDVHGNRGYAFQSKAWRKAGFKVVELEHVFRQDNLNFQSVLAEIRKGVVSNAGRDFLRKCARPLPQTKFGIKPTILYPKNKNVAEENLRELRKIQHTERHFTARDSVEVEDYVPEENRNDAENTLCQNNFFNDCIAETDLRIKVNAQVMLIKNEQEEDETSPFYGERSTQRSHQLINGSRGVVVGFARRKNGKRPEHYDENEYETVDEDDKCFARAELFPVVKFRCGRTKVIDYELFTSRLPGIGSCRRSAIPLKLAWAISIHKSQGMTLDYVKVDVSDVFTHAQTYVALSRATDENGLELYGFSSQKVMADKRALAFYANPDADFPCWNEHWNLPKEAIKVNSSSYTRTSRVTSTANVRVPLPKKGCLNGLAFVFSGEPIHTSRSAVENLVKASSGFVRSAVSGKTNYLVIGGEMKDGRDVTSGVKYSKAKNIMAGANKSKLKILDELEFYALVKRHSK